jgi:hypothetical protein
VPDPIAQIAAGRPVTWERTFQHPEHGELTALIRDMPKNGLWLRHAAEQDRLIKHFGGDPDEVGGSTNMFAAALAGFHVIFEPIVIDERHTVDPDVEGHERTELVYYDPVNDEAPDVALEVWVHFWAWRRELLTRAGEVAKSSGETTGSESDGSSLAGMASPSMTPA